MKINHDFFTKYQKKNKVKHVRLILNSEQNILYSLISKQR